jgi:hypothetical protein
MQMAFFSMPARGDAGIQEELNVFLRSHRVLTVHREFVPQADTLELRRNFFREPAKNVGLEPEHPGRELEQQREQRTLRQRELEQPGQREQQQRVPLRLPFSTMEKLEERTGYPPVSCFRQRNEERMAA